MEFNMSEKERRIIRNHDNELRNETSLSQRETRNPTTSENPNIGALGSASFQELSLRIKGFCGDVVESAENYIRHFEENVMPEMRIHPEASRIIDRAVVRNDVSIPLNELPIPLTVEAVVPLGDEWEGHSWIMMGTNMPGRVLSYATMSQILDLAAEAAQQKYVEPSNLPDGFYLESLKDVSVTGADLEDLSQIFKDSFSNYISDLFHPEQVANWLDDPSVYPIVVRNKFDRIISVSSGDLGEIELAGKKFRFMEIGDSASSLENRGNGLNRIIKHSLIAFGVSRGFHSIHAETRSAWGPPNYGNARNGMGYCGTLPMNCRITGEETIPETSDSEIGEENRVMGSLNVWAMTPLNPNWEKYK